MADHKLKVKSRRFLSTDYDFIADFIDKETEKRAGLKARKDHETLWTEVDRQVRMKPMVVLNEDPDDTWKSALELGDLSTASEVLSADVLRLIFPPGKVVVRRSYQYRLRPPRYTSFYFGKVCYLSFSVS